MNETDLPDEILVIGTPFPEIDPDDVPRRGEPILDRLTGAVPVQISDLQGQVNIFLQQLNTVMETAPEKVGAFHLAEFEVEAGIVLEAAGKIKLALVGEAKASGAINAGLKFVFKRS